jgi:hypothetical protein
VADIAFIVTDEEDRTILTFSNRTEALRIDTAVVPDAMPSKFRFIADIANVVEAAREMFWIAILPVCVPPKDPTEAVSVSILVPISHIEYAPDCAFEVGIVITVAVFEMIGQ